MDYHKEALVSNCYANIPGEMNQGGRAYRKYVSSLLIDELLDKLENFNPKDFVDFLPYITFLQLGMNYSVAVGLSQITVENSDIDKIRLWLIEQCKIIHADSLTPIILTDLPTIVILTDPQETQEDLVTEDDTTD